MGRIKSDPGRIGRILRSLLIWTITALLSLTVASFFLSRAGAGSSVLGYVSSVISFLCALAAGASGSAQKGDRPLLQGMITALTLVILLLTAGFLAKGKELNASGILSVVSFTFAGVLLGAVILGRSGRRKPGWKRIRRLTGKKG